MHTRAFTSIWYERMPIIIVQEEIKTMNTTHTQRGSAPRNAKYERVLTVNYYLYMSVCAHNNLISIRKLRYIGNRPGAEDENDLYDIRNLFVTIIGVMWSWKGNLPKDKTDFGQEKYHLIQKKIQKMQKLKLTS